MRDLLLTLGHNSSAILVEDGKIVAGYENERITGIKSDSQFPIHAIRALPGPEKYDRVYATHWAPSGFISDMNHKHWKPEFFAGQNIRSHMRRTHHDTHAWAAAWFAGDAFPLKDSYILVVDGFGNYGEHFSLYKYNQLGLTTKLKVHGYDTSLGLLYQYATAYLGLKMHEDEYKLLGYEVHVEHHIPEKLESSVRNWVELWETQASTVRLYNQFDPVYNLTALDEVRSKIFNGLHQVLINAGYDDPTSFEGRAAIAWFVQRVFEECILSVVKRFEIRNLIVSGGCFYNVKINKILLDTIPGFFCAYPLAGDQGNALGLYAYDNPDFKFPGHLFWGNRQLHHVGDVDGMYFVKRADAASVIYTMLKMHGLVNVVQGAMEFGPRALCNTSTLAYPTREIVDRINRANNRNTVMPMAPVVDRDVFFGQFQYADRVWRSGQYMITAMEYLDPIWAEAHAGAAHFYPDGTVTGRPQMVIGDNLINHILAGTDGMLINTSFNYHGQPIAYDMPSIVHNHQLQHARDPSINTVVVLED